jgi:hypothetical protein
MPYQGFNDANGNGSGPTVLISEKIRDSDRAAHRQPTIALQIEEDKKIAWKEGCLNGSELASVTNRFLNLW